MIIDQHNSTEALMMTAIHLVMVGLGLQMTLCGHRLVVLELELIDQMKSLDLTGIP
jgi:hypothetical protein